MDWNGDGKKDLLCGVEYGKVFLFLNTGTDADPAFDARVTIQDGVTDLNAGSMSHPVVVDWDRDGKKDLLVGNAAGNILFYRNKGTDNAPVFDGYELLRAGGSVTTIDVGADARPEIADWNDDGYDDLVVGAGDGRVRVYYARPIFPLTLAVPTSASEGDGVLTGQGRVTITAPLAANIVVALTSDDTTEVSVPSSVTITAGNTNATFAITIVDDSELDGSRRVAVTASYPSLGTHRQRIRVDDNESTTLTLAIPSSITEGAGVLQGTVSVLSPPDDDVLVTFVSSDPSEITAASTIIKAGQTTALFDLTVINDNEIDGTQIASITAHVENWTDGVDTIAVHDNENTNLVITVPTLAGEGDGVLANAGRVTISGTLPSNLVVSLASDDTSELIVPATVTINAGSTSATFGLTVVDDAASDGRQTVTVTALNAGFVTGNDTILIADSEWDHFTFGAISSPQSPGVAFTVSITASDVNGEAAWYHGAATLTATGSTGTVTIQPSSVNFTGGQWSGPLRVDVVDPAIRLYVTDGSSHEGTSMVFSTGSDILASFQWDHIPSPRYAGVPFDVSISALDPSGFLMPGFTGIVDISALAGFSARQIGTGSALSGSPIVTSSHDSRNQVIYLDSELVGHGRLIGLALDVTTRPGQVMNNWTIRMKHTSLDNYNVSAEFEGSGWTTVYQTNQSIDSTGWVVFDFSTPFDYDGTNNLMVDFSFNNSSSSSSGQCRYTDVVGGYRSLSYPTDSYYGDPLTWSGPATPTPTRTTRVPNIKLVTGTPVTVTPIASGSFAGGRWSGSVNIPADATDVALLAAQGAVSGSSATFDVQTSDIRILCNGLPIGDDDMTPEPSVGTDFGAIVGSLTKAFTITNQSAIATIQLPGSPRVTLSDPSGHFALTQDAAGSIAPRGAAPFEITYAPLSAGVHSATVTVVNTSATIPVYTFAIAGTCVESPTVANQGATPVDATTATLTGVLSDGVVAAIWFCWGSTDGGTISTANWDNVVSIGSVGEGGVFSKVVSSLATNRTYFYRCYASNASGSAWSDTATSFSGTPGSTINGGGQSGISYHVVSNDGDCGITNTSTYTHAIDWGSSGAATVNGVTFANDINVAAGGRANAGTRTYGSSVSAGNTPPAVSGSISNVFRDMRFGGPDLGYIELTGLTAGKWYDVRLYDRAWDYEGATRTFYTRFDVGADGAVEYTTPLIDQNRATGTPPGLSGNVCWAMSYVYQADSSGKMRVSIDYTTASTYHLYGLSNKEVPAPTPTSIANLAPTAITVNQAVLNASLDASGTNYDVYVYYGTTDGGTTSASWTSGAYVGELADVSTNVSYNASLLAGTSYYYTFMAINGTETIWASPSWQFTTKPPSGPVTMNHSVPHAWLASIDSNWANDYEAAATNDPDGDGFSTWQEYWSGTDPLVAESCLKIDAVRYDGSNVQLEWRHAKVDGGIPPLLIQACTSLISGYWISVGANIPSNGTNFWSETASQQLFYRLAVTNAP